jgi:ATP-binding cassette subfamily B protein
MAGPKRADLTVIRRLLPYLWFKGPATVRLRVVAAVAMLIGAKVTTVYVPIIYKHAVDALSAA